MIEGIPAWLFYLGASFLVLSWAAVGLLGAGAGAPAQYATFDLLTIPIANRALHSRSFRFVVQSAVAALFVFVLVAGLFGSQQSGANIATILTWTYWWTLLVLFVMMFGKAKMTQAEQLYDAAAKCKPMDAMERLDVEAAKAEMED